MTTVVETRRVRVIVAPDPNVNGRWLWTVETQYGSRWSLNESGSKRSRTAALRRARNSADKWLLRIFEYPQGRIEEVHASETRKSPPHEWRTSPIGSMLLEDPA
jgi:hypothetical protein